MHSKWAETVNWIKEKNLFWNYSLKFKTCTISFCDLEKASKSRPVDVEWRVGVEGNDCVCCHYHPKESNFFLIRWSKFGSLSKVPLPLECSLFTDISGLYAQHVDKWVTRIYKGLIFSAFCKYSETCSKCPLTWQKLVALPREFLYKIFLKH